MNDENSNKISRLVLRQYTSGIRYAALEAYTLNSEGTSIENSIGVEINSRGERSYHITDIAAFRNAIDAPQLTNENRFYSSQYVQSDNWSLSDATPSSLKTGNSNIYLAENEGSNVGYLSGVYSNTNRVGLCLSGRRKIGNSNYDAGIYLLVNSDGTPHVSYRGTGMAQAMKDSLGIGDLGTYTAASAQTVSVASSTYVDTNNITLSAGTWIIFASAEVATNAEGSRRILLLNTTAGGSTGISLSFRKTEPPIAGGPVRIKLAGVVRPSTSTTYYTTGWQNSGQALNYVTTIEAIQIK